MYDFFNLMPEQINVIGLRNCAASSIFSPDWIKKTKRMGERGRNEIYPAIKLSRQLKIKFPLDEKPPK